MTFFEYDNLTGRPMGPFVKIGYFLHRGVRRVQKQIPFYARQWRQQNSQSVARQGPLWVVMGDSMAQGIGASAYDKGWVHALAAKLRQQGTRYRIINLSMSGARIEDVLERQLPALQQLGVTPDFVTVMVGSNDLFRKKYRRQAPVAMHALLMALPKGAYIANILGGKPETTMVNALIAEAAAEDQVRCADMRQDGPRSWKGKMAADHFHPNDSGYEAIADVFWKALQRPA